MNGKLGFIIGVIAAALVFGVSQFAIAGFEKNQDGTVVIAFKVTPEDATRMNAALGWNNPFPTDCKGEADCIGKTCTQFLNTHTKQYEIEQAVTIARSTEEAKPGITFDTSVSAKDAEIAIK